MVRNDEVIVVRGHRYRTTASFDAVLDVQKAYKDDRLSNVDKLHIALQRLLKSPWRVLYNRTLEEKVEIVNSIFETQIDIPQRATGRKQERILDFYLDWDYIRASFLQNYGMDLGQEAGHLHWKDFIALFQGLAEDTKIRQVMHIRSMDVPEPTKHNQKQIQQILEMKSYYALPVVGGGGQDGLNRLFDVLERQAVKQ